MATKSFTEAEQAQQIYRCYERERAALAKQKGKKTGRDRSGNKVQVGVGSRANVWVRLAHFCSNRGIDAISYIQFLFEKALLGNAPEPEQLMKTSLAEEYLADVANNRVEIALAFQIQQQKARTRILLSQRLGKRTPIDSWASVLLDETVSLSALYRYCLAHSIGEERFLCIAHFYEEEAARQYRRHQSAYDAIWGEWIPQQLRERND